MSTRKKPLSTGSEWTMDQLIDYDKAIGQLARDFRLDTYPNQIEIITAEQMMDAYATVGMPIGYHHWSFGKHFMNVEKNYRRGQMGLAYEMVINSNPCISYLLEENSIALQALVIAHACYGHNSFFKNNYLFKMWTDAEAIIDYLVFARQYIAECEQRYGIDAVENLLDACHALKDQGVDKYKHPARLSLQEEKIRQQNRAIYLQSQVNELWRTIPPHLGQIPQEANKVFPEEPQENILYFLEKNAPLLEPWQREVIRIVRKIAQYFYPQSQTKIMNEGWATFWHYTLIQALYDQGLVTDEFMLEVLQTHTNVLTQPAYDQRSFQGTNPYALGYKIYGDIRRICENPSEEDCLWFPHLAHTDWLSSIDVSMRNFKDESFIEQYLSPRLIREFKFVQLVDVAEKDYLEVRAIHDEDGYRDIRAALSRQYNRGIIQPDLQIQSVDIKGDRALTLQYIQRQGVPLDKSAEMVLKHLYTLWKFPIHLQTVDMQGNILSEVQFPEIKKE